MMLAVCGGNISKRVTVLSADFHSGQNSETSQWALLRTCTACLICIFPVDGKDKKQGFHFIAAEDEIFTEADLHS